MRNIITAIIMALALVACGSDNPVTASKPVAKPPVVTPIPRPGPVPRPMPKPPVIAPPVVAPPTTRDVTATWTAPTLNVDGSPLTDLASYVLSVNEDGGMYDSVTVLAPTESYTFAALPAAAKECVHIESVNSVGVHSIMTPDVCLAAVH